MKQTLLFLLLWLMSATAIAANKPGKGKFLRIYSLEGHKFQKGHFIHTTDTSLVILKQGKRTEIFYYEIGYVKTKRSVGHSILVYTVAAASLGAIIGYAAGEPRKHTASDVSTFDLFYFTKGEAALAGLVTGSVAGAVAGAVDGALKSKFSTPRMFVINGNKDNWQLVRTQMDKLPSQQFE